MHPLSQAKIDANRANAQQSTGPKTEDGKAASSQNAVTHGLFGKQIVVPDGDRPEFDQLRQHLFNRIQPFGVLEDIEFTNLINRAWQLRRLDKMEAALLAEAEGQDPLLHPATEKRAALYVRYRRNFELGYRAAFKELERLQTARASWTIVENGTGDLGGLSDRTRLLKVRMSIDREEARKLRDAMRLDAFRQRIEREVEHEERNL